MIQARIRAKLARIKVKVARWKKKVIFRDAATKIAAGVAKEAWSRDKGVVFHCNQTFHRGILACIATVTVAFNCVPLDRMSIF